METLEKQKFDALKELADLTIKTSEAKGILQKLEQSKDLYLKEREEKVKSEIQSIIDDSKDVIEKAKNNYGEVHNMYNIVNSYIAFLGEGFETFTGLTLDFKEKSKLLDLEMESQRQSIKKMQVELDNDKKHLESQKQSLLLEQKAFEKQVRKLNDQKETIKRTIERLKDNKI